MTESIIIAIITVCGTALSAFFGVIVASKMTNFRLCALEKKVEMHNNAILRITSLEQCGKDTERRIEKIEHQLEG